MFSYVSSLKILFWCISSIYCSCTHVNKLYLLGREGSILFWILVFPTCSPCFLCVPNLIPKFPTMFPKIFTIAPHFIPQLLPIIKFAQPIKVSQIKGKYLWTKFLGECPMFQKEFMVGQSNWFLATNKIK
jgi:hypothetical protein